MESGGGTDLVVLPTGTGESVTLPRTTLVHESADWFPDGQRVVLAAYEPGHQSRLYVHDVSSSAPRPISPEGFTIYFWRAVSPDGGRILALGPERLPMILLTAGGEPRPVPGTALGDIPVGWTADGRRVWIQQPGFPTRVDLVDIASGERRPWKELTPPDPGGVLTIGPILVTPDGRAYVYSYRRLLDELFLVEGLHW